MELSKDILAHLETNSESDACHLKFSGKYQDQNHDKQQTETPAGVIAPSRVRPYRQHPQEEEDQDDHEDSANSRVHK